MKTKLLLTLGSLLSCTMLIHSQTKHDSIAGVYRRQTAPVSISSASGAPYVYWAPYVTAETLHLDANNCAAQVTVYSGGWIFADSPNTYYGIWRASNDTVTITYTKYYAPNPMIRCYTIVFDSDSTVKPDVPVIQDVAPTIRKYTWSNGTLTPIFGDNGNDFLKEEDHTITSRNGIIPVIY